MYRVGKCRLSPVQRNLASFQSDAFFNGTSINREQAGNNIGVCKTPDTVADLPKKNAAPATTGNGVYDLAKRDISPANNSPKRGRSAMAKYGKPDHKRLAKSLGYVLNQGKPSDWHGFTIILLARATEAEIAALAFAALQALDHDTAYMTASAALFGVLNGEVLA